MGALLAVAPAAHFNLKMAGERNDTPDDGGTERTEFTIKEGNMMLYQTPFCYLFDKFCCVLFLAVCAVCNEHNIDVVASPMAWPTHSTPFR